MYTKRYTIAILISTIFSIYFLVNTQNSHAKIKSSNVHWVFCIDTSGSMKEKGRLDLLNLITEKIHNEFINLDRSILRNGDRVTILSFDEDVRLEVTSLFQTENDLVPIKKKLTELNQRSGRLTFISEAIVQAIELTEKYSQYFHTNALYVFTDGKSEPYSPRWPKERIRVRKNKDIENFTKISELGNRPGLNIWLGVLKWEAFNDARSLVEKMGTGGRLVDLTNFSRLSLEKALADFAQTVRTKVALPDLKNIDFGTIPYNVDTTYRKNVSFSIHADKTDAPPAIIGSIDFDPDNPSGVAQKGSLDVHTTEDKIALNFKIAESNEIRPGIYRGKLKLFSSVRNYGALTIEPSQFNIVFKKSGALAFYFWRLGLAVILVSLLLVLLLNKVRRKIPIKV